MCSHRVRYGCDFGRADAAERTCAVLDHHRLAEGILQVLSEQARKIVRACAGGKWHDDPDLPFRVVVGGKGSRARQQGETHTGEQPQVPPHPQSLPNILNIYTDKS
jgi:hypothetical protein